MDNSRNIRIFVSHHKAGRVFESSIVRPIQVGASCNSLDLGFLRDDSGDNISYKNDRYCELTAQYWAWKNVEADYYGFMHYRRHFVFNSIPETPDDGGLLHFLEMDESYKDKIGLNDVSIENTIGDADIVLPPVVDLSGWCAPSNEIQYGCLKNLHSRDFNMVCEKVMELYPEYTEAVRIFREGHDVYWYNMFVMKREYFYQYCEWLFSILEASEPNVDYDEYDTQEKRTLAFMAERLLTIFIINLQMVKPDIKIKHIKITFLHHTDKEPYSVSLKVNPSEKPVEFLDWLHESLIRSCNELRAINRLPATDIKTLNESVRKMEYISQKNLILYGAGNFGKRILDTLRFLGICSCLEIWDEKKAGQDLDGIRISSPRFEKDNYENTIPIITIADKGISDLIKTKFIAAGGRTVLTKDEFMSMALNCIWNRLCEEQ